MPAVAVEVLLTLYFVLREVNHPHVVQVVRQAGGGWAEGPENAAPTPSDPLVLRFQIGLYTANLRANTTVVHDLVFAREPHPATVVLDLSRLPRMTSTLLYGFRDLDAELAGKGVRLVCANLSGAVHHAAQQEQWWQGVESQGRYFDTIEAAVEQDR